VGPCGPGGCDATRPVPVAVRPPRWRVYNVAAVVDDLIDRVMSDPRLNSNPAVDEAHHRVSSSGFEYLVTEMVCDAAGGPQQYSGRPMGEAHRHLGIAEDEWAAFMDDLHQALFALPRTPGGAVRAGRHRREHERGHRPRPCPAIGATAPVAAGASATVAPPARCHPSRSPRRGSLGRGTQSEEG
jgi:hemoglobin